MLMSERDEQPGEHGSGWADTVPSELLERKQWIVTDNKRPVRPPTGWNDPDKQIGYRRALDIAEGTDRELAFVPHRDDPYVVIDLDDVGSPNDLSDTVRKWVHELDTYTEVSTSGDGLHLLCEAGKLPDRQMKGELESPGSVEVFDTNQYVVITGNRVGATCDIHPGGDKLHEFQRQYLPERTDDRNEGATASKSPGELELQRLSTETLSLDANDIYRTLQEYANGGHRSAQNILRLWESRPGRTYEHSSASEADLALCSHLAFWCQEDAQLMDNCFRMSSRLRDKWDEIHYSNGRTYGEETIRVAVHSNPDTYHGKGYVVWE